MIGWGSGYGKLLLFGEHAAVHGHPALGLALPMEAQAWMGDDPPQQSLHPESRPFEVGDWEIHGMLPRHHAIFRQLWEQLLTQIPQIRNRMNVAVTRRQVAITSTVPYEMGFGSSGALSAALAQAGSRYIGTEASADWLWQTANTLETVFHGTPSGIDTGLAVFGGCQAFNRPVEWDRQDLPRRMPLPAPPVMLLIGCIPRRSSTRDLVELVHRRLQEEPGRTGDLLTELGTYAAAIIQYLERGQATPRLFGHYADEAQQALRSLGVSTPELEHVFDRLADCGSLGGKLSGAGGGGAFYAVFDDRNRMQEAAEALDNDLARTYGKGNYYVQSLCH